VATLVRPRLAAVARYYSSKPPRMSQVEVDEPAVQRQLGEMQMNFVKRAEKVNLERSKRHKFFRRGDFLILGGCLSLAVAIYSYTIWSIKQENFLDDFEMPDPLEEVESKD